MGSVIGRFAVAALLVIGGAAFWSEARTTRQLADAHARLATLHYDSDDTLETERSWLRRLLPWASAGDEAIARRAVTSYWRGDFAALRAAGSSETAEGAQASAHPQRLFAVANAAFRAAQRQAAEAKQSADRLAAVATLDGVMQSYLEVLRADPANADAAFNYEYTRRFRDVVASGKPRPRTAREAAEAEQPVIPSVDLPTGPTIHGRPGAPPPEIPGDQFRTIAPIPYEEREETDPGVGVRPQRRG